MQESVTSTPQPLLPTGLCTLPDWSFVRICGNDAARFLQAQLTCDVDVITATGAVQAAWCNPKGRVLALFHVCRSADGFILFTSTSLLEPMIRRLRMFILRSKVTAAPQGDDECVVGAVGPHATTAVLGKPPAAPWQLDSQGPVASLSLPGPLPRALVASACEPMSEALADPAIAGRLTPALWRWHDIDARLPQIEADTSELFLPQMLNLDLGPGISFKKGCYPGQEIVARTRYLGKVKQRLAWAHCVDTPTVSPGVRLVTPGRPDESMGTVISTAPAPGGGTDLLAVIRTEAAGEPIHLNDAHGPAVTGIDFAAAAQETTTGTQV